jgi:hypothetical protein
MESAEKVCVETIRLDPENRVSECVRATKSISLFFHAIDKKKYGEKKSFTMTLNVEEMKALMPFLEVNLLSLFSGKKERERETEDIDVQYMNIYLSASRTAEDVRHMTLTQKESEFMKFAIHSAVDCEDMLPRQ